VKLILATFIDTLTLMEDYGLSNDEMYNYLRQIIAEATSLSAYAVLVLLSHGKDMVSVKDNLELDSKEISIVQKLFLENADILGLTEELMFYLTCVPISESNDTFVKQRLNLMFP